MRASASLLACALWLAACTARESVVVLPAADGHIGGVVVKSGGKTVVLDKAYAADNPGDGRASAANPDQVSKDFADVLAARPKPPNRYVLKFRLNSDQMTLASQADFKEKVLPDVYSRAAAEIVIVGHTDNIGELTYNDGLSRNRAEAVKNGLLHNDFLSQAEQDKLAHINIMTAGRGQRDDKDQPNTPNPNERYAEVFVQ